MADQFTPVEVPESGAGAVRSVLWLTSRTTFENGAAFCAMRRWLETHAGPYGYGFQRKAMSIPLVTGTYVHKGPELILKWVLEAKTTTGQQPGEAPDAVIRWAVEEAIATYRAVIDKRGFFTLPQGPEEDAEARARMQYLITEQEWLLEGLIWIWALLRLPVILAEYEIMAVEEEQEYVAACTCGLGDGIGTITEHEARGCNGIGSLSRPDILMRRWTDGAWAYDELKTASVAKKKWNDSWEHKLQFMLGVLGAERRYGVEITHLFVDGLIKGQRKSDNWDDPTAPKIQQSCLIHPYYKPGMPPDSMPEWRPSYNYFDREGIKWTASRKDYKKVAIWTIPREVGFPGCPPEMTVMEYWVRVLINEYPTHAQKCFSVIGPIPKQRHMVDKALRSLVCEEQLWQDRVWRIYEFATANQVGWGEDTFHEFVETVVPRSWNCDPYGPEYPCPMQSVCHPLTDDWRNPIDAGLMVYRSPHHQQEAAQMAARGLKPEFGLGEEDQEADGGED